MYQAHQNAVASICSASSLQTVNLTWGSQQQEESALHLPREGKNFFQPGLMAFGKNSLRNTLTTKLLVKENFCVFSFIPLQGIISKQSLEKYTQKEFWLKSMDLNSFVLLGDWTYQNTGLMNSCKSRKGGRGFRATVCSSPPSWFWGDAAPARFICSGDGAKPLPCEISLFNEILLREQHRQHI